MSIFSRKKKIPPSNSAPANTLTSQSTQQLQPRQLPFPPESLSHTPQQQQQSRPVSLWSKHRLNLLPPTFLSKNAPPSGPSPSPFPRYGYALSATAGEL